MKVSWQNGKPYLTWGFHELASSIRTSGVEYPIWDEEGKLVSVLYSTKKAGSFALPEGARYLLTRYWTNSGYPEHHLYLLPEMEQIGNFDRLTSVEEVELLKVPEEVKSFIRRDIFEDAFRRGIREG